MKNCPPGVKCGGSWTNRMMLTKSSGGGGEPSLGYGLLYNWYAATDARGIAPDGWRVCSFDDVLVLFGFLSTNVGGKLKSTRVSSDGDPYFNSPNTGATNESLFTAYPAGTRASNGGYTYLNELFFGVTTTEGTASDTYELYALRFDSADLQGGEPNFKEGGSLRCVRDTEPPSPTATDADGNVYTWVQIGSQYWLQQSLKTTRYNNGDLIPTGLDNAAWAATTDGAWDYPNGDSNLPI